MDHTPMPNTILEVQRAEQALVAARLTASYDSELPGTVQAVIAAMVDPKPHRAAAKKLAKTSAAALSEFAMLVGTALAEGDGGPPAVAESGLSWLDEKFLAFLVARFGDVGRAAESQARASWIRSPASWEPWLGTCPPRVKLLVDVAWDAEVQDRPARLAPVRVPTGVSRGLAHARAYGGRLHGENIFVEPARGETLTFDFSGEKPVLRCLGARRAPAVVGLRQALRARAIHVWIATLHLYQDAGMRADGMFTFDGSSAILDVMGANRVTLTKGGSIRHRFHSKNMKGVEEDLSMLARVRARVVGELEQVGADALVSEIRERRFGRTVTFAHSRLVVAQLRSSYLQIPRAVCSLDTSDVPIALGMATVAREGMLEHLRTGRRHIEAPISDWLEVAGIDEAQQRRKMGPSNFYPEYIERLARIAEEGKLGELTVSGAGHDAVLKLSVDPALVTSYRPLLAAAQRKARALRPAPGRRGRS